MVFQYSFRNSLGIFAAPEWLQRLKQFQEPWLLTVDTADHLILATYFCVRQELLAPVPLELSQQVALKKQNIFSDPQLEQGNHQDSAGSCSTAQWSCQVNAWL